MASAGLTSEFLGQAVVSFSLQQDSYRWIVTAAQQPDLDTPANASQELLGGAGTAAGIHRSLTLPSHGPHHPIQLCNDVVILMQHRQTCSVRTPAAAAPAPARAPFRVVAQKKVTKKQQVSLGFWAPCSHPYSDSIQRWGSAGVFTAPTCGRKRPC